MSNQSGQTEVEDTQQLLFWLLDMGKFLILPLAELSSRKTKTFFVVFYKNYCCYLLIASINKFPVPSKGVT